MARRVALTLLLAAIAFWIPGPILQRAAPVFLDVGPNDADYLGGFRTDWERDGTTTFRWTGTRSWVRLPFVVDGPDASLRLRLRRHFPDPAHVRLRSAGRLVSAFDLAADPHVAYPTVTVPIAPGGQPFQLDIEAPDDLH